MLAANWKCWPCPGRSVPGMTILPPNLKSASNTGCHTSLDGGKSSFHPMRQTSSFTNQPLKRTLAFGELYVRAGIEADSFFTMFISAQYQKGSIPKYTRLTCNKP